MPGSPIVIRPNSDPSIEAAWTIVLATSRAAEAATRWPQSRIAVQHRAGRLVPGDAAVVVAVASPHRAEAFDCCRYVIDRVKEAVPIWKKELSPEGDRWIEGTEYRS